MNDIGPFTHIFCNVLCISRILISSSLFWTGTWLHVNPIIEIICLENLDGCLQ